MSNIEICKEIEATVCLDIDDIEHFIEQCSEKEKGTIRHALRGYKSGENTFMDYNCIPTEIKEQFKELPAMVRDELLKELNEQYGEKR